MRLEKRLISERTNNLVSLGFDGIEFHEFQRLLEILQIRHVVDIRTLAAFRGDGFRLHLVEQLFKNLQINYQRFFELENRFFVSELGHTLAMHRYSLIVAGAVQSLQKIGSLTASGTVLLVGSGTSHQGSDREVITDQMRRLGLDFDLWVVQKKELALHIAKRAATPLQISVPAVQPASPRKTGSISNEAQLALPFDLQSNLDGQTKTR
ncbi:MAG: hypothetical protein IPK82_22275 [Polyangiaceae bacterium]|nr:hypothetical protein [Polyangiaceae bacterium]